MTAARSIEHKQRMQAVKRGLDALFAFCLLLLLSPLLLAIIVAIWLTMGRPAVFRQQRAGLHGCIFTLFKFRTMSNACDASGTLLSDEQRLTRLGRFLRASSFDELPQLWNILTGDMSFIGPRPLLPEYLPRYSEREALRHCVRPGITGWAQTHGRQTIPFSKRLEYDAWYVEHWSLRLDIRIALLTIPLVFRSEGVVLGQHVSEVDDRGLSHIG